MYTLVLPIYLFNITIKWKNIVTASTSHQVFIFLLKLVQGRECFKCGGRGHIARDCLEEPSSNKITDFCLKCGDSGHHMFVCQNKYSSEDLKVKVLDSSVFSIFQTVLAFLNCLEPSILTVVFFVSSIYSVMFARILVTSVVIALSIRVRQ